MQAKLIVVRGKATRSEVELKLPVVIGRYKDADLTIEHPTISRRHCELFEKDGALVVRDFGSLNGTLVDDERVKIELIKPGAILTVGPLSFRAEYELAGDLPQLGSNPLDSGTVEFTPVAEQGAAAAAASAISEPVDELDAIDAKQSRESEEDLGFELADELDDSGAAVAEVTGLPDVEPSDIAAEADDVSAGDPLHLPEEPESEDALPAVADELDVDFSLADDAAADEKPESQTDAPGESDVLELEADLTYDVADESPGVAEVEPKAGAGDIRQETGEIAEEGDSVAPADDDDLLDFEALVLEDVEAMKEAEEPASDESPEAPAEETPTDADDFELELEDLDLDSTTNEPPPPPAAADLDDSTRNATSPETDDETRPVDWSSEDDSLPPLGGPRVGQNKPRDNGGVDAELDLSDVDFHLESTGDLLDDDFAGADVPDGAANDEPGSVELIVKKKSPLRPAKETVTIVSEAPIEAVASEPVDRKPKQKRSWWPFSRKQKPAADVPNESVHAESETQMDAEATAAADGDEPSREATTSPDTHPPVENNMNSSPELPDKSTDRAALQDATDTRSSTETADNHSDEIELTFDEPEEGAPEASESEEDNAADSVMELFNEDEPVAAEEDPVAATQYASDDVEPPAEVRHPAEEADADVQADDPNSDGEDLDDSVAAFLAAAEEDDAEPARKPVSNAQGRPAKDEAELDDFLKDLGLS